MPLLCKCQPQGHLLILYLGRQLGFRSLRESIHPEVWLPASIHGPSTLSALCSFTSGPCLGPPHQLLSMCSSHQVPSLQKGVLERKLNFLCCMISQFPITPQTHDRYIEITNFTKDLGKTGELPCRKKITIYKKIFLESEK